MGSFKNKAGLCKDRIGSFNNRIGSFRNRKRGLASTFSLQNLKKLLRFPKSLGRSGALSATFKEYKRMGILPQSKLERVEFFEAHIAAWVAGAGFYSLDNVSGS